MEIYVPHNPITQPPHHLITPSPTPPEIALIAGPNGVGKSTLARLLIPEGMPFLNADEMAKSLAAETGGAAGDFEAGKRLLTAMDYYAGERRSFAVETTLSSKTFAPKIRESKASGYGFRLIFIYSPSVELCIARVAERVRRGGHNIPEATIRRRYAAGLRNFHALYRPLADEWQIYSNTAATVPLVIADGAAEMINVYHPEVWEKIHNAV